jgi:hypothetical protein
MAIVNGYLTIDEAVQYVGRNETRDTTELEDVVTSVSRLIDRYCGRQFFQSTATARTFDSLDGLHVEFGPFNDLVSATTGAYDSNDDGTYESTVSASGYQLLPTTNTAPIDEPYTALKLINGSTFPYSPAASGRVGLIRITGTYGWSAVPVEVKQAARIMVAEVAKLADAPLGVAGFGEFGVMRVSRSMPARALQLLQPYRHPLNVGMA